MNILRRLWQRYLRSLKAPTYDAIADEYRPGCRCETWPGCEHVPGNTPRISGAVALDVIRWGATMHALAELEARWRKLGHVGSYGRAADELGARLATIRETTREPGRADA